ncbi:MAG TPA: hypothetical protein PK794_10275 [Armatimonadota bacterium]|nr:hypothetical protein [Armatimonadota bacterium]
MGLWGTLLNALQFAPLVLEVTRAVGGKQAPPDDEASPRELHALRQES